MTILFQWIFAHFFADFVLQTSKMVKHKKDYKAASWLLYLHCFFHGLFIFILTPGPQSWIIASIVAVSHFMIDLWKLYQKERAVYFIIDQALHIAVLTILWLYFYSPDNWLSLHWTALKQSREFWIVSTGYLAISFPLSFLLGYATSRWRKEVEEKKQNPAVSLSEAGRWIGIFERILVYTFVLTEHFEGIGFLIAAKSILRFNDIKGEDARKEAEYILIGTLMSFSSSIIAGLITRMLL